MRCDMKPRNKYISVALNILVRLFYNIGWKCWLGIFRLGLFARDPSLDVFCLGTMFVWDSSSVKFRLGSILHFEPFVWQLSLSNSRLISVVWKRLLLMCRLGTSIWDERLWTFAKAPPLGILWSGTFVCELSFWIRCPGTHDWDRSHLQRSLGIFSLRTSARLIPLGFFRRFAVFVRELRLGRVTLEEFVCRVFFENFRKLRLGTLAWPFSLGNFGNRISLRFGELGTGCCRNCRSSAIFLWFFENVSRPVHENCFSGVKTNVSALVVSNRSILHWGDSWRPLPTQKPTKDHKGVHFDKTFVCFWKLTNILMRICESTQDRPEDSDR